MKRLAWLVILVFGTALAQVSPLDLGNQHHKACSCCDTPGDCGMPGCELPVACAPHNFVCESPALATGEATLDKAEEPGRGTSFSAVDAFAPRPAQPIRFPKVARGPLFKVHCSFVI